MTAQHIHAGAAAPPGALAHALREAGIAALIAAALALPLIGLRTVDNPTGLTIGTRWELMAAVVALVALGRFALALVTAGRAAPVLAAALAAAAAGLAAALLAAGEARNLGLVALAGGLALALRAWLALRAKAPRAEGPGAAARAMARISPFLGLAGIALALFFPLVPGVERLHLDIATLVVTYIMLGWGLNIVVGYAGLLDLGYVAFYALGAYSYALLAQYFGFSFWLCLPLAGVLAAIWGVLLGFPVLRLRGDYFAIVTLGLGEIIRIVLINWWWFTGGPNGISGIPRPSFFGYPFERNPGEGVTAFHQLFGLDFSTSHRIVFLYYLILILALLVCLFTLRIRRLPLGRAWEALREDDIACASLGIDRTALKLAAFAIAGMFGGFAGSFFATRQGFISPESFTFIESAIILAIVVLGGMGSLWGIVIAAVLVIGLPEVFREFEEYRMLVFGIAMVAIMVWRPRGLISHREPSVRLPADLARPAGRAA
ncbi:MAG TPA: high-affinity branched-chain amino acid ABC transporter permease LivM [Alphaproteobacteria bacterium]|nr:high-affinity branched-chain amino acid ABC transporter permease LivM [Alphaproteobacteria bacterium]